MCAFSRQNVAEWPNSCHFQGESYFIQWKSFELILVCFSSLLILGINPIKLSHHWCYPFTFCSSLWGCLWNPGVSDGRRLLNGTFLGTVYYPVQGDSNFLVCGWNPIYGVTIQMKAKEQYFPVVLLIMLYKVQVPAFGWNP